MGETPQQIYFLAIVVGLGLTILGFFLREAIATSNLYTSAYSLSARLQKCREAFRKVISRHPSNDMVHLLLGMF